ncbi:IclR family transcriptional regulator [Pigmentiphaga sp.]|jgi:Transcriptional regulator|uniref:IclR family transcriptional regulator n=1 Tax=Pigmentiphaga sp. TaxID=1977564 RepID=UPI0025D01DA3|nr:IclR family transcriptional regulator [Pigmentiphaga sp.]MBX6319988.1 IclR family transcriptional regulator [Pigmentiphaga sp.]
MSQFAKVLKVLDLFSEDRTTLAAEEIADLLNVSRPTAFRYVKQLCETGLLAKLAGRYALGAKIIELDYRIRRSEPILQASRPSMKELAQRTAMTVVLCNIYGDEIVHSHHELGGELAPMSLDRGHTMPLFKGASSAVILANLPASRLKRLYERNATHPDLPEGIRDWASFAKHYRRIRKEGHYISREEIDPGLVGIAAPIFNDGQHVVGAITLVYEKGREKLVNEEGYAELVRSCAATITEKIAAAAERTS